MENDQPKLIDIARRVSKAEQQAIKTANQLLKTGVDSLVYNREKGEITTTVKYNGLVHTQVLHFGDICNRMEITQIDVNDKKARNANIVKMYKEGVSQSELAREHSLSQVRIHGILKEEGVIKHGK